MNGFYLELNEPYKRSSIFVNIQGLTPNTPNTNTTFIAKSSAVELQSHLYVALDHEYMKREQFEALYDDIEKVQRKISNFIKYLNTTLK